MILSDRDRLLLQENCHDDEAYQTILKFFESKLAEQQRPDSRFEKLYNESMDAFIIYDDRFQIIDANPRTIKLLGYSLEDLQQCQWRDLLVSEEQDRIPELFTEWQASIQMRGEVKMLTQSGKILFVQYVSIRDIQPGQHMSILKDLTAERELGLELQKTIDYLINAQALAHLGTWEVDLKTHQIIWSDETYRICGQDKETFQPTMQNGLSIFHPDDVKRIRNAFRISEMEDIPFMEEARIVRPNGEIRWVITRGAVRVDPSRNMRVLQGSFFDITRRKLAEQELQNTQKIYRSLVDILPMNIYREDLDGKLTFGNQFLLDNLQISLDELIGKTPYDFYPEELAKKYRADDQQVIQTGEILHLVEENVSPVTGEVNHVEVIKIPIHDEDGEVQGIQGVFWDVTERQLAEESLRQSEARARALLEAIPDLMFHLNRDGVFIDCVADEADLLAPSIDELIGKTIYDFFPPNLSALVIEKIEETLTTQNVITFEYDLDMGKSGVLTYECRMIKIKSSEVYAIVRDVTQRNELLKQTIEFQLARERSKLLMEFIQGASHEFRTPLATINTAMYLLSNSDDSGYRSQKVEQIEAQIDRLSHLVDTQLIMVRLNNLTSLNMHPFDLKQIINHTHQHMLLQYDGKPEMTIEYHTDRTDMIGDSEYIHIALQQVMDNAHRFTPAEGQIHIDVYESDNHLVTKIQDTGTGISEESLPHVFKMFWREDRARSTPGFGLGLTVTKKIIDLHRGEIMLQSRLGFGTEVTIRLPRHLT